MAKRTVIIVLAFSLCTVASADAALLRVMSTGLGGGVVRSTDSPRTLDCGTVCEATIGDAATITLEAVPATGSVVGAWEGDCTLGAGVLTCAMPASSTGRSVRVRFDRVTPPAPLPASLSPDDIRTYLRTSDAAHDALDSPAAFVAALPVDFRRDWILMSRSESLQPGVVGAPRILLSNDDATRVFTVALGTHTSYPGAHQNAIEYMQWDPVQKNFRFHEIVVGPIPDLGCTDASSPPRPIPCGTAGASAPLYPARSRSISIDDARCPKCHSTRNVPNLDRSVYPAVPGRALGTDGIPAGFVGSKNKPNWDTYDSWGGMLPFNRDRIYQGTVEAAAFRAFFNLWTWRYLPAFRSVIEQLELQPPGVDLDQLITRIVGGPDDGHIQFSFDGGVVVPKEPAPSSLGDTTTNPSVNYSFDRLIGTGAGTSVIQGGKFVTLHHTRGPRSEEGRGVHFFDLLGGAKNNLNQTRIADELTNHRFATGSVPFDPRPIALAIGKGCIRRNPGSPDAVTPALSGGVIPFFTARHGGNTLDQIFTDTQVRSRSMPRRKADIQRFNLDRTNDPYLDVTAAQIGLIQAHGPATLPAPGTGTGVDRLRQDVFRRPLSEVINGITSTFDGDASEIGGDYVDREFYSYNTERVALYRYFLEPLGVSVDKWSMGVRGRSRTYTFADVFDDPPYVAALTTDIEASLIARPFPGLSAYDCGSLVTAVNASFTALPLATDVPRFTDVQRIFNKGCIECHGGLGYPPFTRFLDVNYLNLSEDETAATDRLFRSYGFATRFTSTNLATSRIYQLVTRTSESCEYNGLNGGMMPCGGPQLSQADIATLARWINGGRMLTAGDPHISTVDGTAYDFQAAGEYVLARDEGIEIQARQRAVATEAPLGPNGHTGLTSCVSINTAFAIRVGPHRIAYQPRAGGKPDPEGIALYVDGKEVRRPGAQGIPLGQGGRILPTTAPGGIQIEYPGGTDIIITPGFWAYYQVWHLDIEVRHVRATDGVMGKIAPGNWLPALPDGTFLGPRPAALPERYEQLYGKFAEAWHVTDATSLFVYDPGTSTRSFDTPGWPRLEPKECTIPPTKTEPQPPPPPKMVAPDVAARACADLVEPFRRESCEQDVRVTGDVGFAKTYLAAERISRNALPEPPALVSPADDQVDMPSKVSFTWKPTRDVNHDGLTYLFCVWPNDSQPTFAQCTTLPAPAKPLGGHKMHLLWLLLLLFLILLVLIVRATSRRVWLVMVALLIAVAALLVLYIGRVSTPSTLSRSVAGLQPGKAYYWKVIVQDGQGGTTESETRRIAIR